MSSGSRNGPLGDLYELLDYLTEEIKTESLENERISSQIMAQCEQEFLLRSDSIEKYGEDFRKFKSQNELCTKNFKLLEEKIQKFTDDKNILQEALQELQPLNFSITFEKPLVTIENCISLLSQLKKNPSVFLQIIKESSNLLSINSEYANNIIESFVGLSKSKSVDDSAVAETIEKLQKLQRFLRKTNEENSEIRKDLMNKSNSIMLYLEKTLETTHKLLENLNTSYSQEKECVSDSEKNMKIAQNQEKELKNIIDASSVLCEDWRVEYSDLEIERKKELALIQQIIEENENFWGKYEKTSTDLADFYKEEWDNYSNQYTFKSQSEYQHSQ